MRSRCASQTIRHKHFMYIYIYIKKKQQQRLKPSAGQPKGVRGATANADLSLSRRRGARQIVLGVVRDDTDRRHGVAVVRGVVGPELRGGHGTCPQNLLRRPWRGRSCVAAVRSSTGVLVVGG